MPASDSNTEVGLTWGDRQPSGRADSRALPRDTFAARELGPAPSVRPWYGGQILTADAISLSLVGLGVALDSRSGAPRGDAVLLTGLAGYALAPAVIHMAHGRFGMAPASAAVRVFVPAAATLVGMAAENCKSSDSNDEGFCDGPGAAVGFLVGLALSSALDASLFAWDNPRPLQPDAASFGVTPVLSEGGKRAELRAFGSF